jgi:hypothetical protein
MSNDSRFRGGGLASDGGGKVGLRPITKQSEDAGDTEVESRASQLATGPVRDRIKYNFIRNRVAEGLVQSHGYSWEAARDLADTVTETEIDALAKKKRLKMAGLGDGSFLQWLRDNKDQILQVVLAIISILAMFAGPVMAQVSLVEDEEPVETEVSTEGPPVEEAPAPEEPAQEDARPQLAKGRKKRTED